MLDVYTYIYDIIESVKNYLISNTMTQSLQSHRLKTNAQEIISMLLHRIGIPPPTAPSGESLCIKTGNQIGRWVFLASIT